MSGVSAGALQLVAPPQVRGLVSALYLLNIGLLGSGAGPVAVAAITDFVLKDENKVGQAISITFAIIAPIAVTCFFLGRKPMKAAILDSEAATA
jgi:MFS family permease